VHLNRIGRERVTFSLSIKEESKLISRRGDHAARARAGCDECCAGDNLGAGIPLKVSVETSAL